MSLNLVIDPSLMQALTHALVLLSQTAPMCAVTLVFVQVKRRKPK